MTPRVRATHVRGVVLALLVVAGVLVHVWLGSKLGLFLVGAGIGIHLLMAAAGSSWLARRRCRALGEGRGPRSD